MPKNPNSRPDIQVLEDRVIRLKSQIEEFKGLRLYRVTKQRLAKVCSELEECSDILSEIVEGNDIVKRDSISAFRDTPSDGILEFSDDTDLSDTFIAYPTQNKAQPDSSSPKVIVKTYSVRIQECANTIGCSSGIIQVNQFCQLLNRWYQARFAPSPVRNPNFRFKANRICEWIDLLMIAAGNALVQEMFPNFLSDMYSWIDSLSTDQDQTWPLPYSVMQLKLLTATCCTKEAVLLEKILKPSLYHSAFFSQNMHSIEEIYSNSFGIHGDELELDKIIQSCPRLTVTSSFDASKFGEVG